MPKIEPIKRDDVIIVKDGTWWFIRCASRVTT
jgi:hypothetical protein